MKTEDLHEKLPDSELRNKVGRAIKNCPILFSWMCWDEPNKVDKVIDDRIGDLKKKIDDLEKDREVCHNAISVINSAKSVGWKEWDVSDDIGDYDYKTYINFIGTEGELFSLIENP